MQNTKNNISVSQYKKTITCKKCYWQGDIEEIQWEIVETCMGNDKIETCPICGSFEIKDSHTLYKKEEE